MRDALDARFDADLPRADHRAADRHQGREEQENRENPDNHRQVSPQARAAGVVFDRAIPQSGNGLGRRDTVRSVHGWTFSRRGWLCTRALPEPACA